MGCVIILVLGQVALGPPREFEKEAARKTIQAGVTYYAHCLKHLSLVFLNAFSQGKGTEESGSETCCCCCLSACCVC